MNDKTRLLGARGARNVEADEAVHVSILVANATNSKACELDAGERHLLRVIADYGDKAYPSKETLARKLKFDERKVRRCQTGLEEKGYLRTEPKAGRSNRYHIIRARLEADIARMDQPRPPTTVAPPAVSAPPAAVAPPTPHLEGPPGGAVVVPGPPPCLPPDLQRIEDLSSKGNGETTPALWLRVYRAERSASQRYAGDDGARLTTPKPDKWKDVARYEDEVRARVCQRIGDVTITSDAIARGTCVRFFKLGREGERLVTDMHPLSFLPSELGRLRADVVNALVRQQRQQGPDARPSPQAPNVSDAAPLSLSENRRRAMEIAAQFSAGVDADADEPPLPAELADKRNRARTELLAKAGEFDAPKQAAAGAP